MTNNLVYVSHIAKDVELDSVVELFMRVGDVESSSFENNVGLDSQSTFAVIQMSTSQQAVDCVERFNGYSLGPRRYLGVSFSRPKIVEPRVETKRARRTRTAKS